MSEPNGASPQSTLADLFQAIAAGQLPPDQKQAAIERIRAEGLPPMGSREWASYMRLFKTGARKEIPREDLIARLYADSDVPLNQITRALDVSVGDVTTVRRRRDMPAREDMPRWQPGAHILEGEEELLIRNGQAYFRDLTTGKVRAAWPEANEPEPEPEKPDEPEPVPVAAPSEPPLGHTTRGKPRQKRRRPNGFLGEQAEAEIAHLYLDPNVTTAEINETYGIGPGTLYRILRRHGIDTRTQRALRAAKLERVNVERGGHFRLIDGNQTWVPGDVVQQLHLGQAPAAAPPAAPIALAVPMQVTHREWTATVVMTLKVAVTAPSIDEALRQVRETHGQDVEIVQIERA